MPCTEDTGAKPEADNAQEPWAGGQGNLRLLVRGTGNGRDLPRQPALGGGINEAMPPLTVDVPDAKTPAPACASANTTAGTVANNTGSRGMHARLTNRATVGWPTMAHTT